MSKISVKICKLSDAKFLLKVHNSAVEGGFFNSKKTIKFKDHILWLKNKLKSKSSKIYIGYEDLNKFGYVRFDEVNENVFEISIANHPNFYGKGLGTQMLELAIKKFIRYYKPKKISCAVKKFNIRSQKTFLKNNFRQIKFNKNIHATINEIDVKKENYYEYNPQPNLN